MTPHPAIVVLDPAAQTPQQAVLQTAGIAIGVTCGKPSNGV